MKSPTSVVTLKAAVGQFITVPSERDRVFDAIDEWAAPLRMTPTDWKHAGWTLNVPYGWTLHPRYHAAGYWTLTASGKDPMRCGHRSMQVTATALPLAVARMASRVAFHQRDCR